MSSILPHSHHSVDADSDDDDARGEVSPVAPALHHLLDLPLKQLDVGVCIAIQNVFPQLTELNLESNGQEEEEQSMGDRE